MKTLVLTPVAERDVAFYIATARALESQGQKVVFLSIYQPGNARIKAAGFKVYDPYPFFPQKQVALPNSSDLGKYFSFSLSEHLLHEKLTFGVKTDQQVIEHFTRFLLASEKCLEILEKENPSDEFILIQELAGFVGPLSIYFATVKRGWKHYFTEPGFFKGHIHFLKNSLYLDIPKTSVSAETRKCVDQYLETSLKNKTIVAASKDAHHYKDMGLSKVFNSMNFKNLTMKLVYKYILRHQFIFSHVSNHVFRYLRMLRNRYKNAGAYYQLEDIPKDKKWIYFPFHVQLDFSLTIRSPKWLDQLGLIEHLLAVLPENAILLAKEHPASIGCLDQNRLEQILKDPRFYFLYPKINSYDIMEKCSGVVTINSKVGAEAISMGLPVLSFGRAFYTEGPYSKRFTTWPEVRALLNTWTSKKLDTDPEQQKIWRNFLGQVWQDSFAVELYDQTPANIQKFSKILQQI